MSSEQQSEEPAPIVAAEAPSAEPPPRVPESADVVIIGQKEQSFQGLIHLLLYAFREFYITYKLYFLWHRKYVEDIRF